MRAERLETPANRPEKSSFTRQIAVRIAALVTTTTAIVLTIGGWLLDRQMNRSLEALHYVEFTELRTMIGPPGPLRPDELIARIHFDTEADATLYFVQIHDDAGTVLYRSRNLGDTVLPNSPGEGQNWTTSMASTGRIRISEFQHGPWHLQIASPLAPVRQLMNDYVRVSGLLLAMVAIGSVGLGFGFARFTLEPVRAIRETAMRINADNLGERIPVPAGRDELSALVELLNAMFDRLEASFRQVRDFTAVASHELKTPLSLIRLNAEKLRPCVPPDSEQSAALDELMEEISRLHRLIESLLFLTKAESGSLSIAMKATDTRELLADFAEDARLLAEDCGFVFVLTRAEAGVQHLEPNLVRQLLLNVVANALAVSPPKGRIEMESFVANQNWHIAISDEGPGLPIDQYERVFEPFIRFDHSNGTESKSGAGLGLAICRSIADLHGGYIRARNRSDRSGLRVVVSLPVAVEVGNGQRGNRRRENG